MTMIQRTIKILFLPALMLLAFVSCKKDGTMVIATQGTQPGLTASATTLSYTPADTLNTAVTFTYSPSDFGYAAAINYTLQFSTKGTNFAKITSYAMSSTTKSFTVKDFNTLVLGLKYTPTLADTVYARVLAQVADSLFIYSDTLAIVVTPYAQPRVIAYPFLYVPGDYQPTPNWNQANPVIAKIYSPKNDKVYDGYVNITDKTKNGFKFSTQADWNGTNYGTGDGKADGGALSTDGGAGNLTVDAAGYYLLHADISKLTWTATLQNWTIIGDAANGWSNGDDISLDFDDTDQVLVKTLPLKVGGFKFRVNGNWSYGLQKDNDGNDLSISPLGEVPISTSNNDNIPITAAGVYKITLDLRVPSEPYCTIIQLQ